LPDICPHGQSTGKKVLDAAAIVEQ
jgi:hypothetical protein